MAKSKKRAAAAAVVARKKKRRVESSEPKNNPFEVRVNRRKHDVLGQKMKSGRGLPGVARSRAVQKRKKTLLLEYRSRHKTGKFVDQRFGEYDENLSVEEKVALRFLMEKKKKRHERSGMFNLEEDGNEEGLTHFGQSLGDMEKFDDIPLSDEELVEEDIGETHFGGFLKKKRTTSQHDSEEPKSRKEIMNEVVAKSKQMKYERQSQRQHDEELMDTLDSQWKDVRRLVTPSASGKASLPAAAAATPVTSAGSGYDRVVRELLYERKARATDRLKTAEELAREEREKLIEMEADRVRRMKGEVDGSRGGEGSTKEGVEHTSADAVSSRSKRKRHERVMLHYKDGVMVVPGGQEAEGEVEEGRDDDGEEGEGEENGESGEDGKVGSGEEGSEEDEGGGGEEEEGESEEGSSGEEEVEEEEGGSDNDPEEQFGSDLESEGDSEEEGGGDKHKNCSRTANRQKKDKLSELRTEAMGELPYTFTMPTSLQELLTITEGRSPEECATVVERIHSCYHPSLSPDNKRLLEQFLDLLLSYCCHLGKECSPDGLQTLSKMTSPLLTLAQLNSVHTARVFRKRLSTVHKTWKANKCRFPNLEQVIVFWLVGVVFPVSDFKHPISTPAMMFMGQLLAKCPVKTYSDLALGLLICEVLLTIFIPLSKRFIPELVNFLSSCTALICTDSAAVFYPPFSPHCKLRTKLCKSMTKWPSSLPPPQLPSVLRRITEHEEDSNEGEDPVIAASIITSTLHLVRNLCDLYRPLLSFPEIFTAITFNLKRVASTLPEKVKEMVQEVLEKVSISSSVTRPILQLLKRKPKSIKFYEPSYDEVYDVRKKRTVSKSLNEKQKLRYKVKMERKGAIRELKKDSHFLSREKLKESRDRDAERERKTRQIFHDLQSMQHEAKMERLTHHKRT